MGVFNIHPKGLSSITCSLMETETVDYQVNPTKIDMNESARVEIIYAQGEMGGSVRKSRAGLVPIKFKMVVFGSTQATAMANARTIVQALTNHDGGYIEYRPVDLSASVMSTYYHYLQSKPPKLTKGGVALAAATMATRMGQRGRDQEYGIQIDCEVMTKAWATSDPESPIEIVSATEIVGHDDAADDNYVVVPSSSIKGDALFPIITVEPLGTSEDFDKIFLYSRSMKVGANTNLDWIEAEDFIPLHGGTVVPDADASGGNYVTYDGSGSIWYYLPAFDSTYLGKVTPVVTCKVSHSLTRYTIKVQTIHLVQYGAIVVLQETNEMEISESSSDMTRWQLCTRFGELDIPPFPVPDNITDDTVPSITDYIQGQTIGSDLVGTLVRLVFTETTDPFGGHLLIDSFCLAKASEFVVEGRAAKEYRTVKSQVHKCVVSALADTINAINIAGVEDVLHYTIDKYGSPLEDLILPRGYDHRIRMMCGHVIDRGFANERDVIYIDHRREVTIDGIFGTIYPFEEA
jgi:hypothetical protein